MDFSVFSYSDKILGVNETIVHSSRIHWLFFLNPFNLLLLGTPWLYYYLSEENVITNQRVIIKKGLIFRNATEVNIKHVESINIKQSILGRLFGYGNISIVGSGGTKDGCVFISKPLLFKRKFQDVLNMSKV